MTTCVLNAARLVSCGCEDGSSLYPGSLVRVDVQLYVNGVETDPTDLSVTVTDPSAVETTYTYGVDNEVVKVDETTGTYYWLLTVPAVVGSVGEWQYAWTASGELETGETYSTALYGSFTVYADPTELVVEAQIAGGDPVEGAGVTVFNSSGSLVGTGITDANGQLSLVLPDGVYTIDIGKPGHRFLTASYTKSGAATVTIVGADLDIITPPTIELCRLYGFVLDASGNPISDASIFVRSIGHQRGSLIGTGGSGVNPESVGVGGGVQTLRPMATTGMWEIDVAHGAIVEVNIPIQRFHVRFRVPAQDVLNVGDVRPYPTSSVAGI